MESGSGGMLQFCWCWFKMESKKERNVSSYIYYTFFPMLTGQGRGSFVVLKLNS